MSGPPDKSNDATSQGFPTLEDRFNEFEKENPEVGEALRLFNVSLEYYEATQSAMRTTKTYITTSTLLPGQHG